MKLQMKTLNISKMSTFINRKKCNLLNQRETSEYVSNLPNDKYNIIILSTMPKNKITNFEEFKSNILLINNILFSIKNFLSTRYYFLVQLMYMVKSYFAN